MAHRIGPPGVSRGTGCVAAVLLAALLLALAAASAQAQIVVATRPLAAAEVVAVVPLAPAEAGTAPAQGRVVFGRPVVVPAAAKGFTVPSRVSGHFDAYWVEFAFALRGVDVRNASSLTFQVQAPPHCTALNLVPFLVTEDSLAKGRRAGTAGGTGAVTVGRVLSQQVTFGSLAATILADGLQEPTFSWTLTDAAVAWAPKRLAAVMAVPKGRRAMALSLAVTLRWKSPAGGQAGVQWVARTPVHVQVPLR